MDSILNGRPRMISLDNLLRNRPQAYLTQNTLRTWLATRVNRTCKRTNRSVGWYPSYTRAIRVYSIPWKPRVVFKTFKNLVRMSCGIIKRLNKTARERVKSYETVYATVHEVHSTSVHMRFQTIVTYDQYGLSTWSSTVRHGLVRVYTVSMYISLLMISIIPLFNLLLHRSLLLLRYSCYFVERSNNYETNPSKWINLYQTYANV